MTSLVEVFRPWSWPRAAALTLTTIAAAACSGEFNRFNDNPFAQTPVVNVEPAPAGWVESRPLPPAGAQRLARRAGSGLAGGGRGMASYAPGSARRPMPRSRDRSPLRPDRRPAAIGVGTGAPPSPLRRVTPSRAFPAAMGCRPLPSCRPTTSSRPAPSIRASSWSFRATTKRRSRPSAPRSRAAAPASVRSAPVSTAAASNSGVHVVAPGETLSKISRLYGKPIGEVARVNNIAPSARLNIGDRLVIPGVRSTQTKPKPGPVSRRQSPRWCPPPRPRASRRQVRAFSRPWPKRLPPRMP